MDVDPRDPLPPLVPLGLDRYASFMEAVRLIDKATLQARFQPLRACPLVPGLIDGAKVHEFKLKPKELRVLNAANGSRTLAEIAALVGNESDAVRAFLNAVFFGVESGAVSIGADPLLKGERLELVEVQRELDRVKGFNFFQVLGVNDKSTDEEVKARYTELAKKYHPDLLREDALLELREAREKMFSLIQEANASLESDKLRVRYKQQLEDGRSSQDLVKAQNALLAETALKKAEILLRVKKHEEALEQIDHAIALNNEEPEYHIFHAYLRYLLRSGGTPSSDEAVPAVEAIKDIQGDKAILSGFVFQAHLHKAIGNSKQMVQCYEKVLEIDASHAEAKQELRAEALRRERAAAAKNTKKKWF
ncbi:MAG: J domain-containing protein [Myxococcales bacterium]|nr:J domain-containing protein [Myxococcales bacterium]